MKIILLWIQWSGKWTQWNILSKKFWFKIFEAWQELRDLANEESELWEKIKKTINWGNLVDIKTIWLIIKNFLEKHPNEKNIIFDWVPRNLEQKDLIDEIVKDYKVVVFELSKEKVNQRVLWRMHNPKTWESFYWWILVDPKTWDKLERRKDDNTETVKKRINNYFESTFPVIEKYEKEWNLIRINAEQSVEEVNKELITKLGL